MELKDKVEQLIIDYEDMSVELTDRLKELSSKNLHDLYQEREIHLRYVNSTIEDLRSLLSGENEIDVSASVEHDGLHDVGESHAEADDTTSSSDKEAVESALRKITDDGKDFLCLSDFAHTGRCDNQCDICANAYREILNTRIIL